MSLTHQTFFFQPQPIDVQLKSCIGQFLRTVQDSDLVSILAFYYRHANLQHDFLSTHSKSINVIGCGLFFQNVRRVALVAFNSAAHNKPSLIRDLLESILPQLYNETKIRVNDFLFIRYFSVNFFWVIYSTVNTLLPIRCMILIVVMYGWYFT